MSAGPDKNAYKKALAETHRKHLREGGASGFGASMSAMTMIQTLGLSGAAGLANLGALMPAVGPAAIIGGWAGRRAFRQFGASKAEYTKNRLEGRKSGKLNRLEKLEMSGRSLFDAATLGAIPLEKKLYKETTKFLGGKAITMDKTDPKFKSIPNQARRAFAKVGAIPLMPVANVLGGLEAMDNLVNHIMGPGTIIGDWVTKTSEYDMLEPFKGTEAEAMIKPFSDFFNGGLKLSKWYSGAAAPKKESH